MSSYVPKLTGGIFFVGYFECSACVYSDIKTARQTHTSLDYVTLPQVGHVGRLFYDFGASRDVHSSEVHLQKTQVDTELTFTYETSCLNFNLMFLLRKFQQVVFSATCSAVDRLSATF